MSKIKNPSLAAEGKKEISWARENMPILRKIKNEFEEDKPLEGLTISVALHLEKKTAVLLETLLAGGAEIYAASCNPLSTDDAVAAALSSKMGIYGWAGQTKKEYYACLHSILDAKPDIVIDDGSDLITLIHSKRKELIPKIIGGCEETTTGVNRLFALQRAGKLKFPVIAVNNAYSKFLFDNRYGTGQSTLDALMRITNKLIAGKTCVVVGYGWCGKGIASRLRGMGANVIVCEVGGTMGPHESGFHRALEALYDGFRVMSIDKAAPIGDIFITATGVKNAISASHIKRMKNGAILANAGHFDNEIEIGWAKKQCICKKILNNLERFKLKSGKVFYLLSEGRLVNLARPSAQGHPIEIMDGSFAIQALCIRYLICNKGKLERAVLPVPFEIDNTVARLALESHEIFLPPPTVQQLNYSRTWRIGT
ncbi:MAG: adenosylhomocysteinase [Candidatus Anstonellales archaeon]